MNWKGGDELLCVVFAEDTGREGSACGVHPNVVIDINVLRNERLVEACIAHFDRTSQQIAFPEMALFELTKHPQCWEDTVRGSLKFIARRPEAVVVTRSSKPLGLVEEASGIPTNSVVAPGLTEAFQRVLDDVRRGSGPDLDDMLQAMLRYRGHLDHEKHAADSLQFMQTLKVGARAPFPREIVARIAKDLAGEDRTTFRQLLQVVRLDQTRDSFVRRGVRNEVADALMTAPCISYLFALAVGALGLGWAVEGGVEGAAPGRVANDILDIEYILAALWGGRLISRDARARDHFGDLKAMGTVWWPAHAQWFGRAEVFDPEQALAGFLAT